MKRILAVVVICCLLIPGVAMAKSKQSTPLTGTWDCVAHGLSNGDVNFTLYLTQKEDNSVTGWVASPLGSADLTSIVVKDNNLEILIDAPHATYHLSGKCEKNQVSGTWSKDSSPTGKWEGRKSSDSPDPK